MLINGLRTKRIRTALLTGCMLALVAGAVAGCASYANYPPIGTAADDAAVNDPNVAPVPTMMRTALLHLVDRFPVEGEYVVNLPEGMTRRRAEEFILLLRDPRARLPREGDESAQVFHITQVWLRPGGRSQVEILRPVFGVGTPGDQAEFQPVSVYLRRTPLEAWRVDGIRAWPIGIAVPPPLFGWSDGPAG